MKQNEKIGKFYVLIVVALLVTSVAVAVSMAGPAPYPGTGPAPTPGPTPAPGPGGGPQPYPTAAPPPPPTPTPTPTPPPGAMPDLNVTQKWETFANGQFTVRFTVKNIGNAAAGASTACKYIGGIEVDNVTIPALGAGTNCTRAFTAEPCPPGTTITVTVCADNYNVVGESDETNNCKTNTFTCPLGPQPGGPDLEVNNPLTVEQRVDPTDPTKSEFRVHYTVKNNGNEVAGWSTTCKYVNGVHIVGEDQACPAAWGWGLGPGGIYTGEFGWEPCPCGQTLNVTVCADNYDVVAESNENNNCKSIEVKCGRGIIEVNKTVRDPTTLDLVYEINANTSDVVEFNCTVHNNGSCCSLTNITVTDVLSSSLEFLNANPAPDGVTTVAGGATTLKWTEGTLGPRNWLNYTIFALVKNTACGVDTNTQTANATDCTGVEVTDTATAKVNVATRAGIEVTKTQTTGYNFTLQVTNNGSCCNLTDIYVTDIMTNLTYNATISQQCACGFDTLQPTIIPGGDNTTTLTWHISSLKTGVSKTCIVNTTKMAAGLAAYNNTLSATGLAACTGKYINSNTATWSE